MILFSELRTTLRYHDNFNPKFFKKGKMKSEVRETLLNIANKWADFSHIPSSAIKDIVLVGGNANYNYTEYSDLDLHLIVDKTKITKFPELLDDYLKDKKQLWALTHDITIYGCDVELYAQDISEPTPQSQGCYSIKNDKWNIIPTQEVVNLKNPLVKQKVKSFADRIDYLINSKSNDYNDLKTLKDKLGEMRSSGIKRGGEYSFENLVFKELRNLGYITKLQKYITHLQDEKLSLR